MIEWSKQLLLMSALSCVLFPLPQGPQGGDVSVETVSVDRARMLGYLMRESEKLGQEADARTSTKEKLAAGKERLRSEFRFMIGLDPLPPRAPLNVTRVRVIERDEYTVEVLHYQSLPHFYVTANLYKPKKGKAPYPAVIWGPGHTNDPDWNGAKVVTQNYAIPWVRAGYICLIIDPIQVAEVFGVHRGTHSNDMRDWYCRGYTPIGIEVWNAMRAVDYLLTRPDVDGKRLTINGVSGGGHLSWMAGAADERLAVVQPVAGTADVQAHVQLDLQARHCDCAYFINTYRHDWPTLAALIAPRPLLMHNSSDDPYYPPEGYQRVLQRVQAIYSLSGAAEKAGMFEVPGRHDYTQAEREKAVEWSNLWLRGERTKITEQPFENIPGAQLSAFGGDLPKDAINHKIQELLIPTASLEPYRSLPQWEKARAEILEKLKTVVFRNLPRPHAGIKKMDLGKGRMALETEEGIQVGLIAVPDSAPEAGRKQPAIVYVASPGETEDSIVWNFMRVGSFGRIPATRYVVFPRGIGTVIWDDTTRRRFERSAMLLGRTLDDMRLYDVLCAVNHAASQPSFDGRELTVAGKGVSGALGAYAALLDPRITRVILHSPPLTHQTGPILLNILRYTDLPQTLACLAPRELVFLTHEIDAFDYTRSIYQLYQAGERFKRGYTVSQILNRKEVPQ